MRRHDDERTATRPFMALAAVALLATLPATAGDDAYELGPDSMRRDGVPRGELTEHVWRSEIFPGTIRRYWVYVPAQYDGSTPAALMVFQDGHAYVAEDGQFRVPAVFDNLIHDGDMPVTIGVFIDPGHEKDELPESPGWRPTPENRSFEYDTLSDQYARFLLEEILPEVSKSLSISDDPERRAICGISSGGICAWTVAWERPDSFRRVLSHVGSFTNIRGGHDYPARIRKSERKPIRVLLQDGTGDLDNPFGNWWLANQQMAAALAFKRYDHRFVAGVGEHSGKHGGAILPDSLRWLWRDGPIRAREATIVRAAEGFEFTEGPAADAAGDVYFTDQPNDRILRWSTTGELSTFLTPAGRSNGLYFDAAGNLIACADEENELWSIDAAGKATKLVTRFEGKRLNGPNDVWVHPRGDLYFTDPYYKRPYWKHDGKEQDGEHVYRLSADRRRLTRVATGLVQPNGIVGTPDGTTLYVADIGDRKTYAYTIRDDGALVDRRLFVEMGSDGMTIDDEGNVYLTGNGVTVFDPKGTKIDQIPIDERWTANVCFGGADRRTLFITAMDSLYTVRMRVRGVTLPTPEDDPAPGRQVEQDFVRDGETVARYLLFLPEGYDPESAARWPLVLFLHGRGESYGPLGLVKKWGPPRLVESDPTALPCILVSPQCPGDDRWASDRQQEILSGLLDDVIARYSIDVDRIHLTGLSMGGYGSWTLAAREPDRFASVVPICGGGKPDDAAKLAQLPIWAFHGDQDSAVPLARSVEMVEAIRAVGSETIRLTTLENVGHNSWSAAYATPELWEWMARQRRSGAGGE